MYVTTFYSFKGGVGRTMALVNSAVELANRGRRVLAVDFDLEAPGLDSFRILRPERETPGLIDFVRRYRQTGAVPDANDFLYRASAVGKNGGELWIMPAGSPGGDYGTRFREVDWAELYARYDGYLLFEDLKAQWRKSLRADWVFVDSRTGHTDTGGICTRQLPDAVVAVFFPNEQNLRGLTRVIREIRGEAETERRKKIKLYFVMSNVPDLDDEDEFLSKQIDAFQKELAMKNSPVTVHRYNSLALLNQAVFIQERPKSRLAREYQEVVRTIIRGNLDDRDGALLYAKEWVGAFDLGEARGKERQEKLKRIEKQHARDAALLYELARLYNKRGSADDVARLCNLAIEAGCVEPKALLFRSQARRKAEDPRGATEDAMRVLENDSIQPEHVAWAVELAVAPVETILDTVAVRALDPEDRLSVGEHLWEHGEDSKGIGVLESLPVAELPEDLRAEARLGLSLLYLGEGRCEDVVALLTQGGQDVGQMSMADAFNYGMALWGATGALNPEPFRRVVALARKRGSWQEGSSKRLLEELLGEQGSWKRSWFRNFEMPVEPQCLAIAHWATGDVLVAEGCLADSASLADDWPDSPLLSCWQYARVSKQDFQEDLVTIQLLIAGDGTWRPWFIKDPGRA